jgi:hypothetical protein
MIENVTCEVQHWSMATCPYNDMVSVNYYTGWGWLFLMLLVGLLNPLWFRDSYLHWLQNTVENFSRWRNFKMYGIYLGMNPDVWHALKDEDNKKNS